MGATLHVCDLLQIQFESLVAIRTMLVRMKFVLRRNAPLSRDFVLAIGAISLCAVTTFACSNP